MVAKIIHIVGTGLYIALLFICIVETAHASSNIQTPEELSLSQCNLQKVSYVLTLQSLDRNKPIFENQTKTIKELEQLTAKATDSKKLIGEQLSLKDSDKFSGASQRLATMNMAMLVESRYQRDLLVLQKLTEIADNYYRWNKLPDEDGADAIYAVLLIAWRNDMPPKGTDNNSNKCTLDYALYKIEMEPLKKLSSMNNDFEAGIARIEQIYKKYNTKEMNFSILNEDEKKEVTSIRDKIINPWKLEFMYIYDLENIRHFARISELMRETYSKDILYSGGNIDNIGNTINKLINDGALTKDDEKMLAYWQLINKKIPSDLIKNFNYMKKSLSPTENKKNNMKSSDN